MFGERWACFKALFVYTRACDFSQDHFDEVFVTVTMISPRSPSVCIIDVLRLEIMFTVKRWVYEVIYHVCCLCNFTILIFKITWNQQNVHENQQFYIIYYIHSTFHGTVADEPVLNLLLPSEFQLLHISIWQKLMQYPRALRSYLAATASLPQNRRVLV